MKTQFSLPRIRRVSGEPTRTSAYRYLDSLRTITSLIDIKGNTFSVRTLASRLSKSLVTHEIKVVARKRFELPRQFCCGAFCDIGERGVAPIELVIYFKEARGSSKQYKALCGEIARVLLHELTHREQARRSLRAFTHYDHPYLHHTEIDAYAVDIAYHLFIKNTDKYDVLELKLFRKRYSVTHQKEYRKLLKKVYRNLTELRQ